MPNAASLDLLNHLRQLVGEAHVLAEGDLSAYEQDWRKRTRGKALAVVRPGKTQEVAEVVKACAKAGVSIVPQGGNTGLVVGGIPDDTGSQVLLSLQRMHAIRAVDADNLTITAEAGCVLHHVQHAATEAGLLFPLSLASEGSCTIGGNLGSNAGGTQVLRYGNARDLCLGVEAVLADGSIFNGLKRLRKDNTGYDLRHLLIGSEGTLGIITAASLRLFPRPASVATALLAVESPAAALRLLALADAQVSGMVSAFELIHSMGVEFLAEAMPEVRSPLTPQPDWMVLVEIGLPEGFGAAETHLETLFEAALTEGLVSDGVIAASEAQRTSLWRIRESIPEANRRIGSVSSHDISLPLSAVPEFIDRAGPALMALADLRVNCFGHLGDGNLHYNVQAPEGVDGQVFLRENEERVNTLVFDQVLKFDGSISAEHGVGELKVGKLPDYKDPTALAMMRAVKKALDPHNILNPGRVIHRP